MFFYADTFSGRLHIGIPRRNMDLINHLLDFFEVDLLETQASKLINESKITLNKKRVPDNHLDPSTFRQQ